jgi:alkylation response protein AidB-like acyl-CoA dehydrogenase
MAQPFLPDRAQAELLARVRSFCEEVVRPRAAALDAQADPEQCFSWEIVEAAHRAGIRTLTLAREYGGEGADCFTTALVIEELARADMGVAVVMAQTLKIAKTLQEAATRDQAQRFLPPFRDDPRGLLAIGITEPDNASNYLIPYPSSPFRTRALRVAGGWVLNGKKHFISNGNRARLYLVFAQTDPERGLVDGSTCFLLERGTPGFRTGRVHDKMGERLANNAELLFDDVFVPDEDVLGEVGQGFSLLSRFFRASSAYAAATVLGVADEAYRRAVAWTSQRVQGGRPLLEHATTRQDLARMRMLLDAARCYVLQACASVDAGDLAWDPTYGALPKVFASEVAWEVVRMAMELHGGYGYMRDLGLEKLLRDATAFLHSDGANRTLLLKAANLMFPEVASARPA